MKDDLISRQEVLALPKNITRNMRGEIVEETIDVAAIKRLPPVQPGWTTDVTDILEYLDNVVHPLISPEPWNVYSELHDMVSGLLKHGDV